MKRDMDLIRELLLKLESLPIRFPDTMLILPGDGRIAVPGHSNDEVDYHLSLLREARFIECPGSKPAGGGINFRRLTWEGHEFVDAVRSPEVWAKTKKSAEEVKGFTLDLLKDLAKGFLKKQVEDYTGVKL